MPRGPTSLTKGFVYRTAATRRKAFSVKKDGKFYAGDDVKPKPKPRPQNPTALRSKITPGTVLILLASRFRGKRVVFLKQLESGLLLVSGPYAVNGVPLRRVNQAYVIATSTKIDVSGVDVSDVGDAMFKREKRGYVKGEDGFFAKQGPTEPSEERKAKQEAVDAALVTAIDGVEMLKSYLQARFTLSKGDRPQEMVF
mmetsp:Transcript_10287/g.35000  ORF Transcript_10287/g.35000 Transcript_10287/m.35000 type:complete len:198 (-) Transcript_10287:110-703(-)